jgi:hypothetical protein
MGRTKPLARKNYDDAAKTVFDRKCSGGGGCGGGSMLYKVFHLLTVDIVTQSTTLEQIRFAVHELTYPYI